MQWAKSWLMLGDVAELAGHHQANEIRAEDGPPKWQKAAASAGRAFCAGDSAHPCAQVSLVAIASRHFAAAFFPSLF